MEPWHKTPRQEGRKKKPQTKLVAPHRHSFPIRDPDERPRLKTEEELSAYFKDCIVGTWYSQEGSFSMVWSETIVFYEDGYGITLHHSGFSAPEIDERFKWKQNGEFTIAVRPLRRDSEFVPWTDLTYSFKCPTDVVSVSALKFSRKFSLFMATQFSYGGVPKIDRRF